MLVPGSGTSYSFSCQLVQVYSANVTSRKQVGLWCAKFNNGRTIVQEKQRSRRPNKSTTDENLCCIQCALEDNRRIQISDIAKKLNISVSITTTIPKKFVPGSFNLLPYLWIPLENAK